MLTLARFFFLILFPFSLSAQVLEDFADGDFTANPSWIGDSNFFVISEDFELQSDGPEETATLHLATANQRLLNTEWNMYVRYANPPSTSNRIRIYLVADSANLAGELNGYYLELGQSGSDDGINFFRQQGSQRTLLVEGTPGTIGSGIDLRLRVIRDGMGNWQIFADPSRGQDFQLQASVLDSTFRTTAYFGWSINHTSTRNQDFFFDDISIGDPNLDTVAPSLEDVNVLSANQLELVFSEPINAQTPVPVANFTVDQGIGNPFAATPDLQNPAIIRLNFIQAFIPNVSYLLTVSGLNDLSGNTLEDTTVSFMVEVTDPSLPGEVIINEIYADSTPSVGLPRVEYLELFNRSAKSFNLSGWKIDNGSRQGILPEYTLGPGEYVILSNSNSAAVWPGIEAVIQTAPWVGLPNGGDEIWLRNTLDQAIDSVAYSRNWYGDPDKDDGGYSLERISPDPVSCPPSTNWTASNADIGGTPAAENSVFSTAGDTMAPTLSSVSLLGRDSLRICFSESMDESTLETVGNYTLGASIQVNFAQAEGLDFLCVVLGLSDTLTRGITYQLEITGLTDCSGNPSNGPLTGEVFLGFDPLEGDIVFHELMVDPNPSVGLPETEYIELFNTSSSPFNLDGWVVSNGTRSPTLNAYTLEAGEIVLLVPAGDELLFPNLPNILPVSPWPTLPNGGGTITLRTNLLAPQIDSVSYRTDWYQNGAKAGGGFSLERIESGPTACPPFANWIAAEADTGGTPGFANSASFLANEMDSPTLQSVSVVSPDTLLFCFSESMNPQTLGDESNYSIDPDLIVLEAFTADVDQTCARVALTSALRPGTIYQVSVSGVSDCRGNVLEGTVSQELLVSRTPSAGEVVINEIMADPRDSVGLPEVEYFELFNRSENSYFLQGWTFSNGSNVSTFPGAILGAGDHAIVVAPEDTARFADFGQVIPLASWPSLTNAGDNLGLRTPTGILMDTVDYDIAWYGDEDKSGGGYSLERINPDTTFCIPITNWSASADPSGGTPGRVNSIFSRALDETGPVLVDFRILDADSIALCFDETLDILIAENPTTYSLSPEIEIQSVTAIAPDFKCVRIALNTDLEIGTEYALDFSAVQDCKGNLLTGNSTISLSLGEEPQSGEVIVTEIMADPSPAVGLPNSEYIELYNLSENTFNLENWTLSNGSTVGTLPNYNFPSESYVLLVPADSINLFSGIENLIPVDPWPTLTNSRDNLGLRSALRTLLDSVDYEISWYRDTEKDNGGYALERIDLEGNACVPSTNWQASANENGGTPAEENSIIRSEPDQSPPEIMGILPIAPDTLQVCFSESITLTSSANTENYLINGQSIVSQVTPQGPDFSCVHLALTESLVRGIAYRLEVSGIADCYGNILAQGESEEFSLGQDADPFEVVITEIFADPSPQVGLPEIEYVEIFNRSAKILDISNWSLQDPSGEGTWAEALLEPQSYAILCRSQDVEAYQPFGKAIPVSSFPSLGNRTDSLFLLNDLGIQIDYVFYSDEWYNNEVKADGGFSLEKIDPNFINCNNPGNWSASRDEAGGTPGTANSILGTFQDTIPPTLVGVRIVDAFTLEVFFSEQMDSESLQMGENYLISPTIGSPILGLPGAPAFDRVSLLLNDPLDSSFLYTLTFSGLRDCGGNEIRGSTSFGFPETIAPGDIVLNEILFNPVPSGADFVEIVNTSDKVLDLQDLFLGEVDPDTREFTNVKQIAAQSVLFLPGKILCLTSDVSFQQDQYQSPDTASFYQMESFPSYADAEGIVVLFTLRDTLEIFEYLDDFHFPTLADDEGVSLERLSLELPVQDLGNWHSASATVNFATPGYANSQLVDLVEPESEVSLPETTFTPNGDGIKDVLAINYDFDFVGVNGRVRIFDVNGRLIRTVQNNTLLDPGPGSFFWDGRNDEMEKALIGMYVVVFEVVNQQTGEKEVFKLVSVLADNF